MLTSIEVWSTPAVFPEVSHQICGGKGILGSLKLWQKFIGDS